MLCHVSLRGRPCAFDAGFPICRVSCCRSTETVEAKLLLRRTNSRLSRASATHERLKPLLFCLFFFRGQDSVDGSGLEGETRMCSARADACVIERRLCIELNLLPVVLLMFVSLGWLHLAQTTTATGTATRAWPCSSPRTPRSPATSSRGTSTAFACRWAAATTSFTTTP